LHDILITSAAHSGENIGKKTALVRVLPEKYQKVFFTGELLNTPHLWQKNKKHAFVSLFFLHVSY